MRVLVTGASGFIGSHVVAALDRIGHTPVAFVRNAEKLEAALGPHGLSHIDRHLGDVNDDLAVRRALAGCDALVHTVGIASLRGADETTMSLINAAGTRTVVGAALQLSLDPIVHVSSVAALFPAPGPVMTSEDPVTTSVSPYARSKAEAERFTRAAQAEGQPVVIFYPGGVFGPHDPGNGDIVAGNAMMLEKGEFVLPTGGGNSFVDVRDLASAIAASVEAGHGPRRFMAGGHWTTWAEWVGAFERASDRTIRIVEVPSSVLIGFGSTLDAVARSIRRFDPPIGREAAIFMSHAKPTDDRRIETELGVEWRSRQDSVDDFVRWMIADGRFQQVEPGSSQRDKMIASVVTSDVFRAVGKRVLPPLHRAMARLSKGKFVPGAGLVLTTVGAKSGLERQTPLETVRRADGSLLVIGSNWAQSHHPAWTHNLIANPEATILIGGRTQAVTGELLAGEPREAAWGEALKHWPAWNDYTTLTDREFRIFALTPKG